MALDDVASDDVALDDVAFDDVVPMTWHSDGVAQVTWQSVTPDVVAAQILKQ